MLCNRTSLGERQPLLSLCGMCFLLYWQVSSQQSAVSKRRESGCFCLGVSPLLQKIANPLFLNACW